jgi:RND superfamily putative drug exporter
VVLSALLLFVIFRSLVIPAKAAVMNLLSIGAAFGVITFVFQDGHLGSLIGVDSTGPIGRRLVIVAGVLAGVLLGMAAFRLEERTHVLRRIQEWRHFDNT